MVNRSPDRNYKYGFGKAETDAIDHELDSFHNNMQKVNSSKNLGIDVRKSNQ